MTPDTKLLKKGGEKAVRSVVRALLAKSSFKWYGFVVRAVFKITGEASSATFSQKLLYVLTLMCAKVFISR